MKPSISHPRRAAVVNPPAGLLGATNAVLAGKARRYEVSDFAGPLSLKSVVSGRAVWTTARGRFEIEAGAVLIVEDGEEYSMEIDSLQPVETFCLFFDRTFVRDAWEATTLPDDALLDGRPALAMPLCEPLQFGAIAAAMSVARAQFAAGEPVEEWFLSLAKSVAGARARLQNRTAHVAGRAVTREELARRVARATEYIHANSTRAITLEDIAGAACLSPFHLHRVFSEVHGLTPHRYLTRLRLERAAALLRYTAKPVIEVALACGFESASSFSTLFRRDVGTSPARFRKNGEEIANARH